MFTAFIIFLCWGSFLNVVGYRLIRSIDLVFLRSRCNKCKQTLAWYDLIPLFSWLSLQGKCRYCNVPISFLYPLIELLTATMLTALLVYAPEAYFFAYALFFSALIVVIRSDLESMLISRFASLYLVPLSWLFAHLKMIPLTLWQSFTISIGAFFFLTAISWFFNKVTGKQGMGQGDIDLFALIGAFTGVVGCWFTLLFASLTGSVIGIAYLLYTKQQINTRIPFGPFLSFGAMIYVLHAPIIIKLFITI